LKSNLEIVYYMRFDRKKAIFIQDIEPRNKSFSQRLKEIIGIGTEPGISTLSEIFLEGALGAVVPGVSSLILNYKQNRLETNLQRFIYEIKARMDVIEEQFSRLSEKNRMQIREYFAGLLCDYVIDEQEEEKIKYIANGFVSLTGQETLETHQTFLFLYILKNLRIVDLKVLFDLNKVFLHGGNFKKYLDSIGIDSEHYKMSKEKLLKQGLLKSSYDDEYQKIVKKVNDLTDYALSLHKGKPNRLASNFASFKPKDREHLSSSQLGSSFIAFFSERNE
jgi:hypothetical protein